MEACSEARVDPSETAEFTGSKRAFWRCGETTAEELFELVGEEALRGDTDSNCPKPARGVCGFLGVIG